VTDGPRQVIDRAIRRLNALEYLILAAALILAVAGGALVAFLIAASVGVPFGMTWVLSAIFLFAFPALFVLRRETRTERVSRADSQSTAGTDETDGR
jgi:uncharacterized membrane protein